MSLRERFSALRNLPPFLRDIWRTSPLLALSSLLLRLARALLPIATLYVGKLIVDEAVRLVALGTGTQDFPQMWQSGALDHLLALLAIEFALAVASDVLGRIVGLVDSLLSELY
jgi:ATP-binding cassette subfamily B protein